MQSEVKGSDAFLAFLAYLPVLNLVPLAVRKKSRFLLFHTRQGLYFFSVFLLLLTLLLGLFYIFNRGLVEAKPVEQVLAVLVALTVTTWAVALVVLCVAALRRRMPMLPVLGDLAGER